MGTHKIHGVHDLLVDAFAAAAVIGRLKALEA